MEALETWIYILIDNSFVRVNGVEYACALSGTDFELHANYDEACEAKEELQEAYYNHGYHLADSGYQSIDPSLCFWTRIEKSDGSAHVLSIYRKSALGDLIQFG